MIEKRTLYKKLVNLEGPQEKSSGCQLGSKPWHIVFGLKLTLFDTTPARN